MQVSNIGLDGVSKNCDVLKQYSERMRSDATRMANAIRNVSIAAEALNGKIRDRLKEMRLAATATLLR